MGNMEGRTGRASNGEPCQIVPTPAPHHTRAVGHSRTMVCIIELSWITGKKYRLSYPSIDFDTLKID